jgi:hypothetical protein
VEQSKSKLPVQLSHHIVGCLHCEYQIIRRLPRQRQFNLAASWSISHAIIHSICRCISETDLATVIVLQYPCIIIVVFCFREAFLDRFALLEHLCLSLLGVPDQLHEDVFNARVEQCYLIIYNDNRLNRYRQGAHSPVCTCTCNRL